MGKWVDNWPSPESLPQIWVSGRTGKADQWILLEPFPTAERWTTPVLSVIDHEKTHLSGTKL